MKELKDRIKHLEECLIRVNKNNDSLILNNKHFLNELNTSSDAIRELVLYNDDLKNRNSKLYNKLKELTENANS